MVSLRTVSKTGNVATRPRSESWGLKLLPTPDYRFLGQHITFIPDALYPWPESQIRAIREKDPGFVPVFRRKAYLTQANTILYFIHHGVARYDREAQPDAGVLAALGFRPAYGYLSKWPGGNAPNVIDRWFEQKVIPGSVRHKHHLPPAFVSWGSWVSSWVDETYAEMSPKEQAQFIEKRGSHVEAEKQRKAEEAEAEHANKTEQKYRDRLMADWSPADDRELAGRMAGAIKAESKPFVDLKPTEGGAAA